MRIALFSPYLPKHRGGGEKYLLDVAAVLLAEGHEVVLALGQISNLTPDYVRDLLNDWSEFSGHDLSQLKLETCPLGNVSSWWKKLAWTVNFDRLYYQTDGSLFFSLAGKNLLHIQIPFTAPKTSWFERLKLKNWSVKNTNSEFTKSVIEKSWNTQVEYVHQPMIKPIFSNLSQSELSQKKPMILTVGRFFRQLHCKHQEVLVTAFKEMCLTEPKLMNDWELVCLGTIEDQGYADEVHKLAKNFPIRFIHQASRTELNEYYRQAQIYWHATGYGQDETLHPEKMEHFGISTVEAMSAGVAPVVINKGGQKEIMAGSLTDWTWTESTELIDLSFKLIKSPALLNEVQFMAHHRSLDFGQARFSKTLLEMIK